jgi:23S rRNA (cytidine1920-2'-O)/16S rRNA (cytidine1409-2'-O)-methyltransferase
MQLKEALIIRALAPDDKKAEGLILAGQVLVNDVPVTKPGAPIKETDIIRIRGVKKFVSRAGEKLDAALESFGIPVAGRSFLDIGSSTGGFTDALLQRGAAYTAAIDVGKGLLHQKIRSDARVQVLEGIDFRKLDAAQLREKPEAFVADVSFTSLETMLEKAFSLLTPQTRRAEGIVLFKPQFELPRAERGLLIDGILEDQEKSHQLLAAFTAKLATINLAVERSEKAAVKGTKGNQEYIIHICRQ